MGKFRATTWKGKRPPMFELGAEVRRAFLCQMPGFDDWCLSYSSLSSEELEAVGAFKWIFEAGYVIEAPFTAFEFGLALKHLREGRAVDQEEAEQRARPAPARELSVDYEHDPGEAPREPPWDEGA